MPRPTKLSTQLQAKIVGLVEAGNYPLTAARAAGLSPATLYRWLRDPRPLYRAFRDALDQAEARSEAAAVKKLVASDHRGVLAHLERRFPEHWGKPTQGPSAQAIVAVTSMTAVESLGELLEFSPEELNAMAEIHLARKSGLSMQEWAAERERLGGLYEAFSDEHPAIGLIPED
jgi:hypothetical protein